MKVHLVDGTYELFRSWFGAPSATISSGREVGATRGLLLSMASLLRGDDVTHVACAFDTVIESFRNRMFDGYKTGDGVEPDLLAQFPLAERATRALGIVTWSMHEFEADDAIATAASRFAGADEVEQVVLCTPDKDLAQCVTSTRVVMLDRRRERVIDEAGVREKFGVPPSAIADWLALVGDAADGIPGIPRWGAKSTATVLTAFGSIDDIPEDPSDWGVAVRGAARLADELLAHREEVELYRTLTRLRTDVPLAEDLDDLRYRGPDTAELERLCAELEMRVPVVPSP